MPWTDLSVEQREIVAEYTRQMRAVVGELARTLNHAKALDLMFDGQVSSAWAALLDHDIILDGSGLAGVSSVTKLEVGVLATAMANLCAWAREIGRPAELLEAVREYNAALRRRVVQ